MPLTERRRAARAAVRSLAALAALVAVGSLSWPAAAAAAERDDPGAAAAPVVRDDSGPAASPVVLLGTTGVRWSDVSASRTPALHGLIADAAVANAAVRSVRTTACPADGWLAVSTGTRAADLERPDGCRRLTDPAGDGVVPGWSDFVAAAAADGYGARPGLLGDLMNAAGTKVRGFGPGAAIATATADGRPTGHWSALPASTAALGTAVEQALTAGADLVVVDLGSVSTGSVRPVDERLSAALAGVRASGRRPAVLVASLADRDATPALQLAALVTPGSAGTLARSTSTRQDGLVVGTDIAATLAARLGLSDPGLVGEPLQPGRHTRTDRLATLVDVARHAAVARPLVPAFYLSLVVLNVALYAVIAFGLARGPGRRARSERHRVATLRGLQAVALGVAAVPVGLLLANLVPWWRSPAPAATLAAAALLIAAVVVAVALAGPWRRSVLGSAGVVAAVTAGVLLVDVVTGARLQLSAVIGVPTLAAGRFYGFNNTAFALATTSTLVAVSALVDPWVRAGRRLAAAVVIALVGAALTVVDGAPQLGADFGGPPALIPAFTVLALLVGGARITWRRIAAVLGGAVVVTGAFAVLDWLRPADQRTHLGQLVQTLLDGGLWPVVARKVSANLHVIANNRPLTLLTLVGVAFVLAALWQPVRRMVLSPDGGRYGWLSHGTALNTLTQAAPTLPSCLIAVATAVGIGFAVNDSGISIPALGETIAVPLLIAAAAAWLRTLTGPVTDAALPGDGPAVGTAATGAPATGTPATGTGATGTPATGTGATGALATGTGATGALATGTGATGSGDLGTVDPGTVDAGTGDAGTAHPGTASGTVHTPADLDHAGHPGERPIDGRGPVRPFWRRPRAARALGALTSLGLGALVLVGAAAPASADATPSPTPTASTGTPATSTAGTAATSTAGTAATSTAGTAATSTAGTAPVLLIGVTGLRWDDVGSLSTPALWELSRGGALGQVVVRSVNSRACPVDGWLAVSSGQRAADDVTGGCRTLPAPVTQGGAATVSQWAEYTAAAATQPYGAGLGLLGTLVHDQAISATAIGPGAAIALADGTGQVAGTYQARPGTTRALAATVRTALAGSRLVVVDAGTLRDPGFVTIVPSATASASQQPTAEPTTPPGSDAILEPGRAEQAAAIDARIGAVLAGAAGSGARVLLVSLADSGTTNLQLAATTGTDGGLLTSASTQQPGLVQVTDVLPTLLAELAVPADAAVDELPGAVIATTGGPATATGRLAALADAQRLAVQITRVSGGFTVRFLLAQVLLVLLAAALLTLPAGGRWAGPASRLLRPGLRGLRAGAIVLAAGPVAAFLTRAVPWWRTSAPRASFWLVLVGWAVLIGALALLGPWRRSRIGPAAVVATVTLAVLAADAAHGGRLVVDSPLGAYRLLGARYYGVSNQAFALLGVSGLIVAAVLARALIARGRRTAAAVVIAAVGLMVLVVDGTPGMGSDFGGPPALLPAFALLAYVVSGRRVRWRVVLLVLGAGAAVVAGFAVLDYLRPAADRTHLGRFVATTVAGGLWPVLGRKIATNLRLLASARYVLPTIAGTALSLWAVGGPGRFGPPRLPRGELAGLTGDEPLLRPAAAAVAVAMGLAFAVNDSGIVIPATGLTLAVPCLVALVATWRLERLGPVSPAPASLADATTAPRTAPDVR